MPKTRNVRNVNESSFFKNQALSFFKLADTSTLCKNSDIYQCFWKNELVKRTNKLTDKLQTDWVCIIYFKEPFLYAISLPQSQLWVVIEGTASLNPMLLAASFKFWPGDHWDEISSLSLAKHLVVFEIGTSWFYHMVLTYCASLCGSKPQSPARNLTWGLLLWSFLRHFEMPISHCFFMQFCYCTQWLEMADVAKNFWG